MAVVLGLPEIRSRPFPSMFCITNHPTAGLCKSQVLTELNEQSTNKYAMVFLCIKIMHPVGLNHKIRNKQITIEHSRIKYSYS